MSEAATVTTTETAATTTAAITTPATTTQAATTDASAATATTAPAAAATTTTEAAPAPDWRSTITDPEQVEFAKRVASPADAVKIALDLRKANSGMTKVPGANATPEEIAKFHKAIGVPETAEGYKFDLGREATDADKAIQGELAKVALAAGVPATAMAQLSKAVTDLANARKAEADRVAIKAREETTETLRKELGADYDSHLVLADRAVKQWGNPGFNDLLNKTVDGVKLGDHPDFVRVFGSIGRRMGEGGFIGAVGGTERQSLQAEMNKLMNENPPGTEKYKQVAGRIAQITEALHGTAVVGR